VEEVSQRGHPPLFEAWGKVILGIPKLRKEEVSELLQACKTFESPDELRAFLAFLSTYTPANASIILAACRIGRRAIGYHKASYLADIVAKVPPEVTSENSDAGRRRVISCNGLRAANRSAASRAHSTASVALTSAVNHLQVWFYPW
jgi:hypothetical protein